MKKIILGAFIMAFGATAFAQPGDFVKFTVGDATVTALSDVVGERGPEILIKPKGKIGYGDRVMKNLIPTDKVGSFINVFIIQTKDKTILVDSGVGGKMREAMQKAGVTPDKIDIVLLTHMHRDHIGGLLADGKPVFHNAELWVSNPEKKYWYDDKKDENAVKVIDTYGKNVKLFNFGDMITSDIMTIGTVGHTPGHTSYLFASGDNRMLFWGDIIHVAEVQFALPKMAVTFDVDPEKAIETRLKLMDEVVKNKWSIAGPHLPFPGVGSTTKKGNDDFEWIPKKGN